MTIKSMPVSLLEKLKQRARGERRSLNQQVLYMLERALADTMTQVQVREQAERQAEAWRKLAGKWESDETVQEEIDAIYASRTVGREVDL